MCVQRAALGLPLRRLAPGGLVLESEPAAPNPSLSACCLRRCVCVRGWASLLSLVGGLWATSVACLPPMGSVRGALPGRPACVVLLSVLFPLGLAAFLFCLLVAHAACRLVFPLSLSLFSGLLAHEADAMICMPNVTIFIWFTCRCQRNLSKEHSRTKNYR